MANLKFPKHCLDRPLAEDVRKAVEELEIESEPVSITDYVKKPNHQNQRTTSDKSELAAAIQENSILNFQSNLAEEPLQLIINFLKDKRFDYHEAEWTHVAYTDDGVCEMSIKYIYINTERLHL